MRITYMGQVNTSGGYLNRGPTTAGGSGDQIIVQLTSADGSDELQFTLQGLTYRDVDPPGTPPYSAKFSSGTPQSPSYITSVEGVTADDEIAFVGQDPVVAVGVCRRVS